MYQLKNDLLPATEAEAVKNEAENLSDKDYAEQIIYALFAEIIEEKNNQTQEEHIEELKMVAQFAEMEGVTPKSPYAMLYSGFRWGVEKGFDLAIRISQEE